MTNDDGNVDGCGSAGSGVGGAEDGSDGGIGVDDS